MKQMAVLVYHSQNVNGSTYSTNDHIALAQDLAEICRRDIEVVSLNAVADALVTGDESAFPDRAIALSCDDGTLLDWRDFEHPQYGFQLSFDRILRQHLGHQRPPAGGWMTSFVIASPEARDAIDQGCYGGMRLTTEDWWHAAIESGRYAIGNHSWDHMHVALPLGSYDSKRLGHFHSVDNAADAQQQVTQSSQYINNVLSCVGARVRLFAYPYGHVPNYLANDYLPNRQSEHGMVAAFADHPTFVTPQCDRYRIPRFVCGSAWKLESEFHALLDRLTA